MSQRASTPTPPAPTPVSTPAPAGGLATTRATTTPHSHAITIESRPTPSTTEGQTTPKLSDKGASIRAALASQLRAGDEDRDDGDDSQSEETPKATSTPAATPDAEPPKAELSAKERNAAKIRESLKAREEERAKQQAARPTPSAQPPTPQQQAQTPAQMWAAIRRHPQGPVAGMRDAGFSDKEIKAILEDTTTELIAPGSVRAQVEAEDGRTAAKRAEERAAQLEQRLNARERTEFITAEEQHFAKLTDAKEGDELLYPNVARLSPQRRYRMAERLVAERAAEGNPFGSYDEIALALEDEIASLLPPPPPVPDPTPASPPSSTTTPAAKTKHTRAALPPDLAGESGTKPTKPLSLKQRSEAIRRAAAKQLRTAERS